MSDQADQLRRLVRATVQQHVPLQPGPPLVVVSGGQEGVGTTAIAIQLAKELKTQGKRTVLVDANLNHPDIASKWSPREGLPRESLSPVNRELRDTLDEVLSGDRTVLEVLQSTSEGVRLLLGRWNADTPPKLGCRAPQPGDQAPQPGDQAPQLGDQAPQVGDQAPQLGDQAIDRLLAGLHRLHDATDVIVIDLGCGMSPWAHRFWLAAQHVLLVTTPAPSVVRDSYAMLKLAEIDSLNEKVRIVVNRCWEKRHAREVFARLDHTCHRFLDFSLSHFSLIAEYPGFDRQETDANGQSVEHAAQDVEASLHADDFPQSVRLLAAEVISHCLVSTARYSHWSGKAVCPQEAIM
jgi:MinD-like ATPase involved in chromosome partitioning or flagellar assembly